MSGHFVGDCFMGFIGTLLALVGRPDRFNLSNKALGSLGMVGALAASFTQPVFGYLFDRRPGLRFWAYGPLVCATGISLIGLAPSPFAVACCLLLGGLGNAAFHPGGASAVTSVRRKERAGLAMSLFVGGGISGYAFGPWAATILWAALSPERLWMSAGAGLLATGVLVAASRNGLGAGANHVPEGEEPGSVHRSGVTLLFIISTLRAATAISVGTFLPRLLENRGDRALIGPFMLLMVGAGGLAGVLGGALSDRVGRQPVTAVSLLLAGPVLWFFFRTGAQNPLLLILSGICLQGALPTNIVHLQSLMPGGHGVASSLAMGVAWGIGCLANIVVGYFADMPHIGLLTALSYVVMLPSLAGLLAFLPAAGAGEAARLAALRRRPRL